MRRTPTVEGAGVKLDKNGDPVFKTKDVNEDGLSDMVVRFEIPDLVLDSVTEATLRGSTVGGKAFVGKDAIEIKQQMCVRTLE